MSTSCIYGFYKNGILKVDYNHSDSYPSGFGKSVVEFIRENSLEELQDLYDKMVVVPRKEEPSEEQMKELRENNIYLDFGREEGFNWDLISICNYKFFEYYKKGVYFMPDYIDWFYAGQDWAYLIDLDDNLFQVYKCKYAKVDFADSILEKKNRYKDKYQLLAQFDLSNIPKNWYLNDEF